PDGHQVATPWLLPWHGRAGGTGVGWPRRVGLVHQVRARTRQSADGAGVRPDRTRARQGGTGDRGVAVELLGALRLASRGSLLARQRTEGGHRTQLGARKSVVGQRMAFPPAGRLRRG